MDVNFENLNVELHVLIISSMFAKFQEDQRLIVMLSIKCLNLKFLSNCELCHSISKSIGDEKDTLKSFMTFDITPRGLVFRVVVGS